MAIFVLEFVFWISLALVTYTYVGYPFLLYLILKIRKLLFSNNLNTLSALAELPEVSFIVAAYNEESYILDKIENTLQLDYPPEKMILFFVTDGSSDQTPQIVKNYPFPDQFNIRLLHQPERRGKNAAIERAIGQISSPIVIFSDANTAVNSSAIRSIVRHYENPQIGAVAGEKRVKQGVKDDATAAGEGFYWKYESTLKKWDFELYSVVGAAGELFSVRTELYEPVPKNIIIEDFYLSLRIAQRGYRVAYAPDAYALESSSASTKEELKRKIRIAAGGIQAIVRLKDLLNIFKYGVLSFQYISHRVLRWTLAPLGLLLMLIANLLLTLKGPSFYQIFFEAQLLFYLLALTGYFVEKRKVRLKILFIPYYFCVMNYAVYRGFFRYVFGTQSAIWDKAKRREPYS